MNVQETINDNTHKIKTAVEDLLILEVLIPEISKTVNANKQKVLNHFSYKNETKLKHNLINEPDFIKNHKIDYQMSNKDFKTYNDINTLLNLKSNLYTINKDFGPDLVLNSQKIEAEHTILNLFFPKQKYIPMETREQFLHTIKTLFIKQHNIKAQNLNPEKFKVFGKCKWSSKFIKEFSVKYQNNPEVLNFLKIEEVL